MVFLISVPPTKPSEFHCLFTEVGGRIAEKV